MNTKILFSEGELHTVTITVPDVINLALYKAKIQVRLHENAGIEWEYSTDATTLNKVGQSLVFSILGSTTVGRVGNYRWQLMLYTTADDVIKFSHAPFCILPAIVK